MCFSMQASFAGAVVIGTIGLATLRYVQNRSQIFIALIPCFFALQQLTEGVLWMLYGYDSQDLFKQIALYTYLFFATLFWPVWIPFAVYMLETMPAKKRLILGCLLIGIGVSLANLYNGLMQPVEVTALGHSLHYMGAIPPALRWLYALVVIIPCFFSSFKNMWMLGAFSMVTAAIAYYLYDYAFLSVWCFFSALSSSCLLKILRDEKLAHPMQQITD